MQEQLHYEPAPAEGWRDMPVDPQILPIPDDDYLAQISENLEEELPELMPVEPNDEVMIFVAGGPSAGYQLEEIRERARDPNVKLFTSNMTHDWLIENGIVPWGQVILDPKPSMLDYVRNPHPDVVYFINAGCNPGVFRALRGHHVVRVFSLCNVGRKGLDAALIQKHRPSRVTYLGGGTMAPLRFMYLAEIFGAKRCEFYGLDSCYEVEFVKGEPRPKAYYAYDKQRVEHLMEVQASDGRVFLSSPGFASQARQFFKWEEKLDGVIEFVVHGDGLIAHEARLAKKRKEAHKATLGGPRMSDEYRALNQRLHEARADYGTVGARHAEPIANLVGQLSAKCGPLTLLDYGCGKRTLERALTRMRENGDQRVADLTIRNYDPCIPGLDAEPEPADIVVCTDVLEHVEPLFINDVMAHLQALTKKAAYFEIATMPAMKTLPDGRNAHLIQEPGYYWYPRLRRRFVVGEFQERPGVVLAACQAQEVQ